MILLKYKLHVILDVIFILLWYFLKMICIDKSIVNTNIFKSLNHYQRIIICSSYTVIKLKKYYFEFWFRYIEILINNTSFIMEKWKKWFLCEKQKFVSSLSATKYLKYSKIWSSSVFEKLQKSELKHTNRMSMFKKSTCIIIRNPPRM